MNGCWICYATETRLGLICGVVYRVGRRGACYVFCVVFALLTQMNSSSRSRCIAKMPMRPTKC